MPKRSNAFQRAMFLLRKSLADGDTEVTESAELLDPVTGSRREVDILIKRKIAGASVVVAVECTDLSVPADVGWVEKMIGKHSHLQTHALVLASGSGFTPEAIRVATARNVETVKIGEVDELLSNKIVGKLKNIYQKFSNVNIQWVKVTFEATGQLEEETIYASPDQLAYTADGTEVGPLIRILHDWLRSAKISAYLLRDALPHHTSYTIGMKNLSSTGSEKRLFLQSDIDGIRAISNFEIHGGLTLSLCEIPLRHASVDGRSLAWGEGEHDSIKSTLLVDETSDLPPILSVHFEDKVTEQRKERDSVKNDVTPNDG